MPEYINISKVLENDFMTYGSDVFSVPSIGIYKAGYESEQSYNIRLAVYQENGVTGFIFATIAPISDINIGMYNPYGTRIGHIVSIENSFDYGYYSEIFYTTNNMSFYCDVYQSKAGALSAVSYLPTPSPESGVVVTAMASPSYTPSMEGVIVTAIARLSDPNNQGGTSDTGGGQGTFDETSDVIPVSPLPTISAAQSGLVTLFKPTLLELRQLGSYLWTNITDFIENLNKLFINPMDYMIALNIVPCNPAVGTSRPIKIGSFTTSISMLPVESQWHEFDCGYINIPGYWGSALDYSPYTKVSLFLPFIGSVQLNTDEVMNNRIGIKYRIDLLSGQCVAMVTVSSLVNQTDSVYYQYTGECSVSVPLTGSDWSRIYSAAIGAVGTAITGGIAAGAAGAAAGGATAALVTKDAAQTAVSAGTAFANLNATSRGISGVQQMRADMIRASQMALQAGEQAASAPARVASGVRATRIANTVNNTVGAVMSGKHIVNHSGTITGSAGMLGVKVPYVVMEFPNQSLADNYKHFVGYPSNMYARLGDLHGYTECEKVIASGLVDQTDEEITQILEALKGGVYL